MSKQPTSKRQWRDGAAPSAKKTAKPFKSKARPKDETRKTASKPYGQKVSDDLKPQNAPKQRAAKARKLVVRNPNQKIMEHARDFERTPQRLVAHGTRTPAKSACRVRRRLTPRNGRMD